MEGLKWRGPRVCGCQGIGAVDRWRSVKEPQHQSRSEVREKKEDQKCEATSVGSEEVLQTLQVELQED